MPVIEQVATIEVVSPNPTINNWLRVLNDDMPTCRPAAVCGCSPAEAWAADVAGGCSVSEPWSCGIPAQTRRPWPQPSEPYALYPNRRAL